MPKTDRSQLLPYLDAGWTLIPLHRWDRTSKHKNGKPRQDGKRPLHSNWTKRRYDQDGVVDMFADEGHNAGVRLTASQLVIDVDPRNFPDGHDSLAELCRDLDLDVDAFPCVETGSGGKHLYMTKPEDISVVDTLDGYPGVEFKTKGRQVVAAGSVHPNGKQYNWDFLALDLEDAPAAPQRLLGVIRRPVRTSTAAGGGEYDQEEIAEMLDVLDPEDYRDHDAWLTIMMACHHASGGDARYEFIEWSTRDPEYSDASWEVGMRWDSLHREAPDGGTAVTHRTLLKALIDAGHEEAIPRTPAADDFQEDGDLPVEDPDVPEHEHMGPLEKLSMKFTAVMEGGKFVVMYEEDDPTMDPVRKYWNRLNPYNFSMLLANRRVQKEDGGAEPIADAWLKWGGRKTLRGALFDPERDHDGFLNLWTGWGVKPRKKEGGWSHLEELLYDVLCDGDKAVYEYVLNWAAHMVQFPGRPAEVALCFQGAKGVGKGTFGRALMTMAGRHGMQITSPEHLTGRFNSHLRDKILLFADEAINPYDKSSESRLKGFITEPVLAFEGKGVDVVQGKNHLHIVMASNEDWFVPMGLDGERRFLLQMANKKWQGDQQKFDALNSQLRKGGLGAMLWDLLNRPLAGWTPRGSIPVTSAAAQQKLRGMTPVAQWWFNMLTEGRFDFELTRDGFDDWDLGEVRAFKSDVKRSFLEHCSRNGIRGGASSRSIDRMFAEEIRKLVPELDTKGMQEPVPEERVDVRAFDNGRAYAFEFPPLDVCRGYFDDLLGAKHDW